MAGEYPSVNDRVYDLWLKIADNFYARAVANGVTGLNPPSINDAEFDLLRKITYYTAALVDSGQP